MHRQDTRPSPPGKSPCPQWWHHFLWHTTPPGACCKSGPDCRPQLTAVLLYVYTQDNNTGVPTATSKWYMVTWSSPDLASWGSVLVHQLHAWHTPDQPSMMRLPLELISATRTHPSGRVLLWHSSFSACRMPAPGIAWTVTKSAHSATANTPAPTWCFTVLPMSANFLNRKVKAQRSLSDPPAV